jgi:hypothetical protein
MGKYQFGQSALAAIGIYNSAEFLRNPNLQEKHYSTHKEQMLRYY